MFVFSSLAVGALQKGVVSSEVVRIETVGLRQDRWFCLSIVVYRAISSSRGTIAYRAIVYKGYLATVIVINTYAAMLMGFDLRFKK